ncbi:MAG: exodeoxyribonuclease VII small subunit [bacterium]
MKKNTTYQFANTMEEIDNILNDLESSPDMNIDKTLINIERGLTLIQECKQHLKKVQNRVKEIKAKFPTTTEEETQ